MSMFSMHVPKSEPFATVASKAYLKKPRRHARGLGGAVRKRARVRGFKGEPREIVGSRGFLLLQVKHHQVDFLDARGFGRRRVLLVAAHSHDATVDL